MKCESDWSPSLSHLDTPWDLFQWLPASQTPLMQRLPQMASCEHSLLAAVSVVIANCCALWLYKLFNAVLWHLSNEFAEKVLHNEAK